MESDPLRTDKPRPGFEPRICRLVASVLTTGQAYGKKRWNGLSSNTFPYIIMGECVSEGIIKETF